MASQEPETRSKPAQVCLRLSSGVEAPIELLGTKKLDSKKTQMQSPHKEEQDRDKESLVFGRVTCPLARLEHFAWIPERCGGTRVRGKIAVAINSMTTPARLLKSICPSVRVYKIRNPRNPVSRDSLRCFSVEMWRL